MCSTRKVYNCGIIFLKNKEYIEIIIRRCGGNKEYWRNIKERVKDWNIKGIKEEIERMIEFSLKR